MSELAAHAPTQAAQFSGPGKHAIALYAPAWSEAVLEVLRVKPTSYEAAWRFSPAHRAHVLEVAYENGPTLHVALVDGVHNEVVARLARGCALVLSPFPLYREQPGDDDLKLFAPEESVVLPQLPSPLEAR